mmetsp:Transcript_1527/g.2320  ORF Transcript_1527/g.2320 Transcript_1527/m.2320 type:complete len:115 (-) Transcript_1527:1069-1413(-)
MVDKLTSVLLKEFFGLLYKDFPCVGFVWDGPYILKGALGVVLLSVVRLPFPGLIPEALQSGHQATTRPLKPKPTYDNPSVAQCLPCSGDTVRPGAVGSSCQTLFEPRLAKCESQ